MDKREVTRREILLGGATAWGAAALSPLSLAQARSPKRARNVIFCVSDGMSAGVPTMVDHLSLTNRGRNSYWGWLMQQPFATNGLQDTRSLNSLVTDSSAASSAWGSGRHIWNGQVNMFPDGTKLATLAQLLHDKGVRVGLASTATITHATPAGFAVNCMSRDDEAAIAERYLADEAVDVLLGGGARFFDASSRKDKRDLTGEFARLGFEVCRSRGELLSSTNQRLLGLFASGHVPYTVDRQNSPQLNATVPTLAEMTGIAIDRLSSGSDGFVLQVEGARIDHGAHSNDLAAALYDQMEFEEAVKIAVDFAQKDGQTLVVVTSDHGNGNPGLNGAGAEYIDSTAGLLLVNNMRASYGELFAKIPQRFTATQLQDAVKEWLGIELTAAEADAVVAAGGGASPFKESIFYRSLNATLAVILGNHTKVTWTSTNHTSDHVLVTAIGPGREAFAGLTQNTSMFDIILAAKGLKHSNPTMTFEQAKPLYEKWKSGGDEWETAHWL
ncbi:MAG: alkaline phosphatase [Fimbriimonadaceae bacterium]|nr:alkaline phosphatase [Fimbriimonadaceae bacterium]